MKQSNEDRSNTLKQKRDIISLIQSQKKTTKKSGATYQSYVRLEKEAIEAYNTITPQRN